MSTNKPTTDYELSDEEVSQFYEEGYLGPLRACSPEEATAFADTFQSSIRDDDDRGLDGVSETHDRHRDSTTVYEFLTQPGILDRVRSLYGPNLLLWTSHFWEKEPGDEGVPWHQEQHFSAIEPPITATLDLALDPYPAESGCFQVIPGSHEEFVPHSDATGAESQGYADPAHVDETAAVDVELEAGEFLIYNSRLVHRTQPNRTETSTRTISCRLTTPLVDVQTESPLLYDDHAATVVSGDDWGGRNETTAPPTE